MSNERTPLLKSVAHAQSLADDVSNWEPSPSILAYVGSSYGALRGGQLPSTTQICQAIDALLQSDVLHFDHALSYSNNNAKRKLSEQSESLLLAVRKFLNALKRYLLSHLAGDSLQDLIFHVRQCQLHADVRSGAATDIKGKAPAIIDEASDDSKQAVVAISTLARVLLSNILNSGQSILDDLFFLLRTQGADASQEVANVAGEVADVLRPDERPPEQEGPVAADQVEEQARNVTKTVSEAKEAVLEAAADVTTLKGRTQQAVSNDLKEILLARFQKVASRIRDDQSATKSILVLLDLFSKYLNKTEEATNALQDKLQNPDIQTKVTDVDDHAKKSLSSFQRLVEELSGKSTQPIIDTFRRVSNDIQTNDELSRYFNSLDVYVKRILNDPRYAATEEASEEAVSLYEEALKLEKIHQEWASNMKVLKQEAYSIYTAIVEDQQLAAIRQANIEIYRCFAVLSVLGPREVKQSLYSDMFNTFLPRLATIISYFPVPRTEITTPALDFLLDDFLITKLTLLPTLVRVFHSSTMLWQQEGDYETDETVISVDAADTVYVRGLKFAIESVSFWLRRKNTWFPFFREEQGLVAVSLLKRGLEVSIDFELNNAIFLKGSSDVSLDSEEGTLADIKDATVSLPDVDINITKTNHPFLFWLLRPAIKFAIRLGLKYVLSSQLKSLLETLNIHCYALYVRAMRRQRRGKTLTQAIIEEILDRLSSSNPGPEPDQIPQARGSIDEGPSALTSAKFTSRGLALEMADQEVTINIGGKSLLPEVEGPERVGPHGSHGGGSLGRIATQADTIATEGAVKAEAEALKTVETAEQAVNILVQDRAIIEESTEIGMQTSMKTDTWRSPIFDI